MIFLFLPVIGQHGIVAHINITIFQKREYIISDCNCTPKTISDENLRLFQHIQESEI